MEGVAGDSSGGSPSALVPVSQLPAAGEVVIFDRSWYNRPGVERVMGFCSEEKAQRFLELVPRFEATYEPSVPVLFC